MAAPLPAPTAAPVAVPQPVATIASSAAPRTGAITRFAVLCVRMSVSFSLSTEELGLSPTCRLVGGVSEKERNRCATVVDARRSAEDPDFQGAVWTGGGDGAPWAHGAGVRKRKLFRAARVRPTRCGASRALDEQDGSGRRALAQLDQRAILRGRVPRPGRRDVGELDHHHAARPPRTFERLVLAAPHEELPAVAAHRGGHVLLVALVGLGI